MTGASRTLFVMAKVPVPGRVKTRLARDIGPVAAAWWFRHQLAAVLRRTRDRRWSTRLLVTPDRVGLSSRVFAEGVPRDPQGPGDLGRRMARALAGAPPGPVILIGSDIPGTGRREIARAFAALRGHDAVIGPATDGGFWLIGLRHPRLLPRRAFQGVRWSGPHALADTEATIAGLRIARADRLADVDRAADLPRRFCA